MPVLYKTGDWFNLGQGNTYRKFEIYNMDWPQNADLEQMVVCAAPYGGPIAISKDPAQFVKVSAQNKPMIRIFTSAGRLLSKIQWKSGTILTMGWSDSEDLLCVQDDGTVLIHDMFGNYLHAFSMGQEAKDTKILRAKIFPSNSGTGIAVMTKNYRVFLVNNIKEPQSKPLAELPKAFLDPTSWEIVTDYRNTCSIIAREKEIFKLRLEDNICTPLNISMTNDYASITDMAVSFNHRHIALFTNSGCLWMGSSDLKTKYCEFNTGRLDSPKQIAWILDSEDYESADAIVITYPSLLLIIGMNGDSNTYPYDPAIFLIPEMDGVRVLTGCCHEMIQKVPKAVWNIFSINSQEGSSYLFEAHKKFQEKSHKSDEYLCLVKDIQSAVDECIEGAGYEFDTETQKSLIRAAHFGKGFVPSHNPSLYISTARILRVLNAIRHENFGIPLTFKQFNDLTPNVILDRLVFRKHYGLAIQIAKHLKLPESRILEHWAVHKIINDKNDQEVARKICEKFKNPTVQGVSFCNIAKKAQEKGRSDLAIMLLESEPKSSLKVPLLLKLGKNEKALKAATESGDTDLVYTVLFQLKQTTELAKFLMIIRSFPMALNLYKKYCQMYNTSGLRDIFSQEDEFLSQAEFTLRECIATSNVDSSLSVIGEAYKKAIKYTEADLCEETRKLLKVQKVLNEKSVKRLDGLTLHDTVYELLKLGDIKSAEKLRNDFKLPERRYWWIRIQILAERFQWDELEKFSKSKKSPIGYEPFVEVCLKMGKTEEALKYIPKCRDEKKAKWYTKAGSYEEAALVCFELRDLQGLYSIHEVVSRTGNSTAAIERFIAQLSSKK